MLNLQTAADWAAHFRHFAAHECPEQPLYVALCHAAADSPAVLALCAHMPPAQARANLLLAALHEHVLAGVDHPLADYYPSRGGQRAPDAELPQQLRDFTARHEASLRHHLRTRATQTNEPGRCAVLRLALDALAAQGPRGAADAAPTAFALFDLGCSAGLNLAVDSDRLDTGSFQRQPIQGSSARLQLRCDWRGPEPAAAPWHITHRLGVDLSPVDISDEQATRWLQACVWPDDTERFARLARALAHALRHPPPVRASRDGLTDLCAWLDTLPTGTQPVLFTSWVLAYCSADERADFRARVQSLIDARGLAWICAEGLHCHAAPTPPLPMGLPQAPTLWRLQTPSGLHDFCWSHPHGAWALPV